MEIDNDKKYYNLSARVQIPANGTQVINLRPFARRLESIQLSVASGTFTTDAGVIISNSGLKLYPDAGSDSDSNYAGKNQFGALLPLGNVLELPFNRDMEGPPHRLDFEFYNAGGSPVQVVIIVTVSQVPAPRVVITEKKADAS